MLKQSDNLFEKCHWCGRDIVWHQKLPKESILNLRPNGTPGAVVRFKLAGRKYECPIVTVDHLTELSKGGSNYYKNLVLSCVWCNARRSSPRELREICVQCGEPKPDSKAKRCKRCIHKNRREILTAQGVWEDRKPKKRKKTGRPKMLRHIPHPFYKLFALYEDPIYREFLIKVGDC